MKKLLLFAVAVGLGVLAARQFKKTPQGAQFFDGVDAKAHEFSSAVIDGYKEREAELRAAITEAEDTIADLRAQN